MMKVKYLCKFVMTAFVKKKSPRKRLLSYRLCAKPLPFLKHLIVAVTNLLPTHYKHLPVWILARP